MEGFFTALSWRGLGFSGGVGGTWAEGSLGNPSFKVIWRDGV